MTPRKPVVPSGLGAAGSDLWRRLNVRYAFDEHELPALQNTCAAFDDVAQLEQLLAEQGLTVEGSKGQLRLSPVVAQLRAARLAAARLLGSLLLPVEDASGRVLSPSQARGKHAADTRWGREAKRREAHVRGLEGAG